MSDEFVFIKPSEKKSEPKTQTFTPDAASESGDFIFVKPSEEKGKSSTGEFSKALTNPALLAGSAVLGAGTVGAQRIALPTEVQKAAHDIRREAAEYVKSGKVPPSGLTSIQKYAGSQQNAIAPQNIDPIHSTPSLVQQNVVHPLTQGTQKTLEISPGAKTIPGSEVGLVHEGHPATVKSLEKGNPLVKGAPVNARAVAEGTPAAEKLAMLTESLSPSQKKMLAGLLEKGYSMPDVMGFFGKMLNKTAVPLAVASIPEQLYAANEYRKAGDYQHMITSGLGAAGGVALGAGAGLAALAAAPEVAAGLGIAGGIAGAAPLAQSVYDWYKERQ